MPPECQGTERSGGRQLAARGWGVLLLVELVVACDAARLPQVAGEHQRRRGWAGRKSIRQPGPSQRRTRPMAGLARRVAAASASCASRTAVAFPGLRVVMVIASGQSEGGGVGGP